MSVHCFQRYRSTGPWHDDTRYTGFSQTVCRNQTLIVSWTSLIARNSDFRYILNGCGVILNANECSCLLVAPGLSCCRRTVLLLSSSVAEIRTACLPVASCDFLSWDLPFPNKNYLKFLRGIFVLTWCSRHWHFWTDGLFSFCSCLNSYFALTYFTCVLIFCSGKGRFILCTYTYTFWMAIIDVGSSSFYVILHYRCFLLCFLYA
jgi:hypothetical protein